MADFHSKMSVCRHELGVKPPSPDNSNPPFEYVLCAFLCYHSVHFTDRGAKNIVLCVA